jgi:uncharacterized protein YecE (DUF72 family)
VKAGRIFAGIGGWSYEPWRQSFYPPGITKKNELHYASRHVTAIEINSTFYRLQTPQVFAKWRADTPAGFVFALKAPRFVVQRKVLAQAGTSIERFLGSGISELGDKLGPILWQLEPGHVFAADDVAAFLAMLPPQVAGLKLRHALGVRNASFRQPRFVELAQQCGVAVVFEDDAVYPAIAEVTTDFVYARLRRCVSTEATGYTSAALQGWVECARAWSRGEQPPSLPSVRAAGAASPAPRDVFVFFINGAKERAPAAARAFLAQLE